MRRSYKTEGIILKRWNLGEADRLLTIFTSRYGKIKALAKGIRKITSRKAGKLELFNNVILFLNETRGLVIITEVELVNNFEKIRKDLELVYQAFRLSELVDCLTAENQENKRVFALLKQSLQNLNQKTVFDFEIELLQELGFGLPTDLGERSLESFIEKILEKKLNTQLRWSTV